MNPIQKIVGKIIALWALILFSVTLIIACIPISIISLWPKPKKTVYVFKVLSTWMIFFFTFTGVSELLREKNILRKERTM